MLISVFIVGSLWSDSTDGLKLQNISKTLILELFSQSVAHVPLLDATVENMHPLWEFIWILEAARRHLVQAWLGIWGISLASNSCRI